MFKSIENPSCNDLYLTNSPLSFQNTTTISTGLSDFHKMTVTVLKTTFKKIRPKKVTYRDYKKFNREVFEEELQMKLDSNIHKYSSFETIFLEVLNKHAPIKNKFIRANHAPYMTKNLRKAIMKRSQLETKYMKNKTPDNLKLYKKHRNYCSKLYKKERKKYYNGLDLKCVTDNKNSGTQ